MPVWLPMPKPLAPETSGSLAFTLRGSLPNCDQNFSPTR